MFVSNDGHRLLPVEMLIDNPKFSLIGRLPKPYIENDEFYEVLIPESMLILYPGIDQFNFLTSPMGFEIDYRVFATGYYQYDDVMTQKECAIIALSRYELPIISTVSRISFDFDYF